MKQNSNYRIFYISVILVVLGILVFAGIKSSHYISPKRPAISQQSIKNQPSTKNNIPAKPQPSSINKRPPVTNTNSPPPASSRQAPQPTANLGNTGPGDIVAIFTVATLTGTGLSYFYRISRRSSAKL